MTQENLEILKKFIIFSKNELGIKKLVPIKILYKRPKDITHGGYDIGKEILAYAKNRHLIDVCRSIGHELVHHLQFEKGELNNPQNIPDIGGKIEDDANSIAGQLIKKFTYKYGKDLYENIKSKKNLIK